MSKSPGSNGKPDAPADETAGGTPALVPQPHGGALLSGGVIGNKGGRPPDAFRAMCRALATKQEVLEVAKSVLEDRDHPAWLGTWKFVVERGFGKEAPVDQDGNPVVPVNMWIFGDRTLKF